MGFTTLRVSEVSLGAKNTSLRLRACALTFWSYLFLEDGTLADEGAEVEIFSWLCDQFPPPDFYFEYSQFPVLAFFFALSCSLSLSPLYCWAWVLSLEMFMSPSIITFLHSVFTKSTLRKRTYLSDPWSPQPCEEHTGELVKLEPILLDHHVTLPYVHKFLALLLSTLLGKNNQKRSH